MSDRCPAGDIPDPGTLSGWLDEAWATLATRHRPSAIWIECASVAEALVVQGGPEGSRSRRFAWAVATIPPHGTETWTRTRQASASTLDEIPPEALMRVHDRADRGPVAPADGAGAVALSSEAAAVLVKHLSVIGREPGRGGDLPVGPGWRLLHDPSDRGEPSGGSFDDAGFPTRRAVLADGRAVRGRIGGPGSYRRPSFRDAPAPFLWSLAVEPSGELPPDHLWVEEVEVVPLARARWALSFHGMDVRAGRVGPDRRVDITVDPRDLLLRCVAAPGAPVRTASGVLTPPLVFDLGTFCFLSQNR